MDSGISILAGYWAKSDSQLATTAAIEGVPFTLPNPGWVASIPTNNVGAFFNHAMLAAFKAWLVRDVSTPTRRCHRRALLDTAQFYVEFKRNISKVL